MSRFQSNIIINYVCRKISKIFLKPTGIYLLFSQMCPAIYLPAPALKLAHKSVRRQIAPPYIPSTLHRELNFTKKSVNVSLFPYTYYISLSHSHLCDEKSYFFLSKLFRFTHTVFKFRANFQKDILCNMICI